jgi:hypothetical protein
LPSRVFFRYAAEIYFRRRRQSQPPRPAADFQPPPSVDTVQAADAPKKPLMPARPVITWHAGSIETGFEIQLSSLYYRLSAPFQAGSFSIEK